MSGGWAKGLEGQRRADLGDGTFLNPIMAGDHPDPSILKDGEDYFMTFSSFDAYPGLAVWHSIDLVNWQPVTSALTKNIGSVWAPELCKHGDTYFIYIPTKQTSVPGTKTTCWVICAKAMEGPWSDPLDLDLPNHIDPGHAVGEDGSRWLFLSSGDRIRLADDGLSTIGMPEHVYDPWRYPDDWIVEALSHEGPKLLRHGDFFYMISAIGGTAGPPTGHMVIAARSKSIHGPWENDPHNPLVRTVTSDEYWWSRGHATLVEGPAGDWWTVYHGYEHGFWTLGRQTLLAPVTWTTDGWPAFGGGDLSTPLKAPMAGQGAFHGLALSDDFRLDRFGLQWGFHDPGVQEANRMERRDGVLCLQASGDSPANSSPLLHVAGDLGYEFDCLIDPDPGAIGGLLLFYDHALYCGLSYSRDRFVFHKYGIEHTVQSHSLAGPLHIRLRNDRHIVTLFTSGDGVSWSNFGRGIEVSGYHHNVRGGFLALKPGLYAAGEGQVRFQRYRYRTV